MRKDDIRWQKWCANFDAAERDIKTLFHNRHVWNSIQDMWVVGGPNLQLNTIVTNWFIRNYVTTQCTGIRRECDTDSRTSSLARCLRRLTEVPHMANRARYEASILADPEIAAEYKTIQIRGFDMFALTPDTGCLDQDPIEIHIEALHAAARATRYYTNKIVAHREITDEKITLAWTDLDQALNTVGRVFKHYYRLRHPGKILGLVTPDMATGWEQPFRSAWCPDDFWPAPASPALDFVLPEGDRPA
ncbi:hypothetical protein [Streptomyces sp. NPDC058955]|uniref:hypothetical protein n=1 Tax=unclassified Streptomyces TaxID=2593676 RepID=UPI0036525406